MDARGNKLSSCKIQDQYLKKQKVIKLLELWQLWLKKEKKRIANTLVLFRTNYLYQRLALAKLRHMEGRQQVH